MTEQKDIALLDKLGEMKKVKRMKMEMIKRK